MKDSFYLLTVAVVCALLAWLFFSSLQNYAFLILGIILIVSLINRISKSKK